MAPRSESGPRTFLIVLLRLIVSLSGVHGLKDATIELQPLLDNLPRFTNELLQDIRFCEQDFVCQIRYLNLAQNVTGQTLADVASIAMAAYSSFYQLNGVIIGDQRPEYAPSPQLGTFRMRDEPFAYFGLLPQTVEVLQTSFFLSFPELSINQRLRYASGGESISRLRPIFQDNKLDQLYVIVHDWLSLSTEPLIKDLEFELHKNTSKIVFPGVLIVNWEIGAQTRGVDWTTIPINQVYAQAAVNTVLVGHELGLVLYYMWQAGLVEPRHIHVIGHGLGAHVAHFAGQWFQRLQIINQLLLINQKLGRITGLNPTALGFQGALVREGLNGDARAVFINEDDALFVDIIAANRVAVAFERLTDHLNLFSGRAGFAAVTGHVTFFVNDPNRRQPYCNTRPGTDLFFGCIQDSSLYYFLRSVQDRVRFSRERVLESVNCENYVRRGECIRKARVEYFRHPSCYGTMGIDAPDAFGRGQQFLDFDPNMVFDDSDLSSGEDEEAYALQQQVNQLINFYRNKRNAPSARQVIDRFPNTEEVDNVQVHPEDRANCGLFRTFPGPPPARMEGGDRTYRGQFPWTVCFHIMSFTYRSASTLLPNGTAVFRVPRPVYKVDQEYDNDGDQVLSGVARAWGDQQTVAGTASTCTGSLIHAQWVVTAAHCFNFAKNGIKMALAIGGVSCRRPISSVIMTIEKRPLPEQNVFIPEAYLQTNAREFDANERFFNGACTQERGLRSSSRLGDIALIKLPEPLDIDDGVTWPGNRRPNMALNTICWRSAELFNYPHRKELFASAYGSKGPNAPNTGNLNWIKVQIVRRREFLDANKFFVGQILNNAVAGSFNTINLETLPNNPTAWAGKKIIFGDSGGPFNWYVAQANVQNNVVANSRAVLVGIVSSGVPNAGVVLAGTTRLTPDVTLMTKAWLDWMVAVVAANTNPLQPQARFPSRDPVYLPYRGNEGDYDKP